MLKTTAGQSVESAGTLTATSGNSSSPINLWLVDDNHQMRNTLMELFGHCEGINCTGAFSSPNHVLSALASKVGPDVILLDVHMGELNGLDAIRPIKSLSRSTQVLMLTTFFDSESQTRALRAGASGFLLKSFPIETILSSIRQAWNNPAPHSKRVRSKKITGQGEVWHGVQPPQVLETTPTQEQAKRSPWIEHCLGLLRGFGN